LGGTGKRSHRDWRPVDFCPLAPHFSREEEDIIGKINHYFNSKRLKKDLTPDPGDQKELAKKAKKKAEEKAKESVAHQK